MSSRKRVKSVTVDQILFQVKQMTKNDCSMYRKLSCYDQVLKKYKIDSLNQVALEIYEYLIEEQTVATLPERSRVKIKPLKFSRSEIQIFQDESMKYRNDEIQDPQSQNEKLFSFAKNNKHEYKRQINEDQIEPKQLFMEPNKFKSENKPKYYPSRLQRFQQEDFLDNLDKRPLKHSKSKSVKALSRCENMESERNFTSKSFIFKSQKAKQNEKVDEDFGQQQYLQQKLRKKHIVQFLSRLRRDKQQSHYQAINKRVKYIYCMKLFAKSFESLKIHCQMSIQNTKKVNQFRAIKEESFLEQVFLEWRALSIMNQQWKERIQMIEENFGHLCSYLFINRLKSVAHLIQMEKKKKEILKKELQSKGQTLLKKVFYQSFAFKSQIEKNIIQKSTQFKRFRLHNCRKDFIRNLIIYLKKEKQKQQISMNKVITKISGKRLIKNLLNEQNFMQVYWKRRNQSRRIIFMNYLLCALRSRFQRLGYQYSWMRTLDQNMDNTDSKIGHILSLHKKIQIFKRLILHHTEQKQKRNNVKIILMDSFLKRLAYSHYIKFKKQSQINKQNELIHYLYSKYGSQFLSKVMKAQQKSLQQKYTKLKSKLIHSKSNQFFIYLDAYKRTKNHYNELFKSFQAKRQMNLLSRIWGGFKRVLKEQVINKKLVAEYLKLKDKVIIENCFEGLKSNVFEEKLFRKKEQNLIKLIKLKSFDYLIKKLAQNLKYEPFKKKQIQYKFFASVTKRRKHDFISHWRTSFQESFLSKTISQKVVENYSTHLVTKCFKIMKFVTVKSKQESQIFLEIKKRHLMRKKYEVFEGMLQMAVKGHSIRRFSKVIGKIFTSKMLQNLHLAFVLLAENSQKDDNQ